MCSRCKKRIAAIFVTKLENGEKVSEGLCLRCAKELGVPVDNMLGDMMGQLGLSSDQLESIEDEVMGMVGDSDLPSDADDAEDGGAPAIDFPKLFRESGLISTEDKNNSKKANGKEKTSKQEKKNKFLNTYCRNLTSLAAQGKIDRIIGRERELARVIQILCRRQKRLRYLRSRPR